MEKPRGKIAERLENFEFLANTKYLDIEKTANLWLKHLQNENKRTFDEVCTKLEKNVKWLPKLSDYYEVKENESKTKDSYRFRK